MHVDQDSSQAAPPRLLVAADTAIDPHRLVKICSDHAGGGAPSVSLLVPVDLEKQPPSMSAARAEGLLRVATALFDAAGIRVEDIALADEDADFVGQSCAQAASTLCSSAQPTRRRCLLCCRSPRGWRGCTG